MEDGRLWGTPKAQNFRHDQRITPNHNDDLSGIHSVAPGICHNAPESAANQYMRQAEFDKLVARFEDPSRAEWQKPEKIIAGLEPLGGKTVADIGVGTGYFASSQRRRPK